MKKFLSLLLAMTMVMSLIVLPARATENELTFADSKTSIDCKTGETAESVVVTAPTAEEGKTATYSWSSNPANAVQITPNSVEGSKNTATVTAKQKCNSVTITCTMSISSSAPEASASSETKTVTGTIAVTDMNGDFMSVVTGKGITYNGRDCVITGSSLTYYPYEADQSSKDFAVKDVQDGSLSPYTNVSVTFANDKVTVSGKKDSSSDVKAIYTATASEPTLSISAGDVAKVGNVYEVIQGGTLTLTASANGVSSPNYRWYNGDNLVSETASYPVPTTNTTANAVSLTCKVYSGTPAENGNNLVKSTTCSYKVVENKSVLTINKSRIDLTQYGQSDSVVATLKDNSTTINENVKYNFTVVSGSSSTSAIVPTVTSNTTSNTASYRLVSTGTLYVKVSAEYKGKTIYVSNNSYDLIVKGALAETTLSSVVNGQSVDLYNTYSYGTLNEAARRALSNAGLVASNATVSSVILDSRVDAASGSGVPGAVTTITGGYRFTAAAGFIGVARIKGTATVNATNYTVYFKIPVTPYNIAYEDQYPEPVATTVNGTTYRYAVQVPNGYTSYYVVAKNASVAPSDWSTKIDSATHTSASPYYLYDTDFIGGKCTLYVVTYTSSTTYPYTANVAYCGTITVYQKNYNINYNGVAGETVQFKHADFTNFMNEVSQARGDASKTGSYPYVTFNYVTFNYPTSTQGTLYYNGTAMSNSSYSGSFNSHTQITNLDNVTFVPYARTSAKSIPLTFTLSVTKYGANGAVVNRDLKYTGTVVVSIVREDIKYTAAPGDTIRFTDSDFLNYLRTQNGFNSNYYSIDYVTFDQSAVNALNEGVLYSYYSGYNAVKSTDKFYYTTTSYNQNALSDVTFRASAYAKTGTTVYIPFTIYARYGTTGTGTRQVSGTVAIKLAQTMNFVDVKPTDYFYDSVKWAVNSNITKGTSATTFSPYKTCTRAEIVTFLWRAAGSKTPTITRNPFTDVAPSMGMDYYYAILWASQNGIAAGTSATTFSPNATCTRAQIVTFLWRYSNKPAGYYSNPFTDVNKAEHAAYYDAILWAVGKGITKGTTATTFSPYGTCTRGEAVTFLYRAVNGK